MKSPGAAVHLAALAFVLLVVAAGLPFRTSGGKFASSATPWAFEDSPYTDARVQRICDSQPTYCPGSARLVFIGGPLLALGAILAFAAAFGFVRSWDGATAPLLAVASACLSGFGVIALVVGLEGWFGAWSFVAPKAGIGPYAVGAAVVLVSLAAVVGLRSQGLSDKAAPTF